MVLFGKEGGYFRLECTPRFRLVENVARKLHVLFDSIEGGSISTKGRVDAQVSSAESQFHGRGGGK